MEQIQRAMNAFWDLLEDVPGLQAHRPSVESGSTMGGWYAPRGIYKADELGGVPLARFAEAVRAEGGVCSPRNRPGLHEHPLFNDADIYGHGRPTRIANSDRDVRQPRGSLPVTETDVERVYSIPWFKHYRAELIAQHVAAYRKVAENAQELL